MDIELKLNEIICKYKVDRWNPVFRKYLEARKILEEKFQEISVFYDKIILVGSDVSDVEWFQFCIGKKVKFESILFEDILKSFDRTKACYVVVSYYLNEEIVVELLKHDVEIFNIYNLFEEMDIVFEGNFFDVYNQTYHEYRSGKNCNSIGSQDINAIFFRHRIGFEKSKSRDVQKRYLEKMIFDCTYVKDFLMLFTCIDMYIEQFASEIEVGIYISFKKEIEDLLVSIKAQLENRNKEDCILVWLDALEYGEDYNMPFLLSINEKGLYCEKMFTVTPYTHSTLKTLFTKKRVLEEKGYELNCIDGENGLLIQALECDDYKITYHGFSNIMDFPYKANYFYNNKYECISRQFWNILRDILNEQSDCKHFSILHELLHTHTPFVSLGLKGEKYNGLEQFAGRQIDSVLRNNQAMESRKYVDDQLEFWNSILPDRMFKIFFSDHGHTTLGKYHTIFKVLQKDVKPVRCDKLISYYDFCEFIPQLLRDKYLDEEQWGREFAIIQDVDYYSEPYILARIAQPDFSPDNLIEYQGVVTKDDMYIRHKHGVEYYQKFINDGIMVTDDRLDFLGKLVSKKQIDVDKEEKFKYSRIFIHAEKRCKERTREEQKNKLEIVKRIFESIPEDKVFALRGGGLQTVRMLMLLEERLRRKVSYIIDRNPDCVGGRMGIRVISMDEVKDSDIEIVLLSAFDFLDVWKKEFEVLQYIKVIDMYEKMKEVGIECSSDFFNRKYTPCDFE